MRLPNFGFYLKHPIFAIRRALYKIYEIRHPDEPWIAQGAVRYCEKILNKDMVGLEWGSGRSTTWFASKMKHLVSVEFDEFWYGKVKEGLEENGVSNVDLRHIPLDHPKNEPTPDLYDPLPKYVEIAKEFENESLDFVVVDGHYRVTCILEILIKIKKGGILLVDNTNRVPLNEWRVPSHWPLLHQSENVMTETTIWQKPL